MFQKNSKCFKRTINVSEESNSYYTYVLDSRPMGHACFRRNANVSEEMLIFQKTLFQKILFQKAVECFRRILLKDSNVSEERPPDNIDGLSVLHMFSLPLNNTVEEDIL
jgi:hypothetical protein